MNEFEHDDSFLAKYRRVCPVCGKHMLDSYEICDCGWQNDQQSFENPDRAVGPNQMGLNEARAAYKEGRQIE